jgi:hypothetical protein
MTQQHSVGPPDELIETWIKEWHKTREYQGPQSLMYFRLSKYIAICSAQWGADQELEACCEWLEKQKLCHHRELIPQLRAARRPKPPSLKEQALEAAHIELDAHGKNGSLIIRALEALPDG